MPKFFNRNCAVVYIDDSVDDHFLFQHAVSTSETPLHVQPFFSFAPAIAYLKGETPFDDKRVYPFPAFLLCDYDLRISKAPQVVAAVRALPSGSALPIIVFSGSSDPGCILRSYLAGADHYLRKPTSPARMVILVRSLYDCAMLSPKNFAELAALQEHQPRPTSTRDSAATVYYAALD